MRRTKLLSMLTVPFVAGALLLAGCATGSTPTPEETTTPNVAVQPTEPTNFLMQETSWEGLEVTTIQTGYGYPSKQQLLLWGMVEGAETPDTTPEEEPTSNPTDGPPPLIDENVDITLGDLDYSERVIAVKFVVTNNTNQPQKLIALGLGNSRWNVEAESVADSNSDPWLMDNNIMVFHDKYLGLPTLPENGWEIFPGETKEVNLDFYVPKSVVAYAGTQPDGKVEFISIFFLPQGDDGSGLFSPEFTGYAYLTDNPSGDVPQSKIISSTPAPVVGPVPSPTPSN